VNCSGKWSMVRKTRGIRVVYFMCWMRGAALIACYNFMLIPSI
jgi:hypothetical protein